MTTRQPAPNAPVILVVDDEEYVLRFVARALENAGYKTLQARGASEALALAASADRIDLLLTDVVLPGPHGPALAEVFARLFPRTPVLFMAGLTDTPEIRQRVIAATVLAKPFLPDALVRTVSRVLAHEEVPAVVQAF